MSQHLNSAVAVVGIDIGKNSFHVIGLDDRGAIVLRQKWSRGQIEARLANLPPCLIGMEACVGAHHLSRKLKAFGHDARLMPASMCGRTQRDKRTTFAMPRLAFVCNEKEKYVAVLLIPLDGTLLNRQNSTSVLIQKTEEYSDRTDLLQRWENGPDYVYLESPDEQEQLVSYLRDREGEGVKSVHFYFPNDQDARKATNHMVIDLSGFSMGLDDFKKGRFL